MFVEAYNALELFGALVVGAFVGGVLVALLSIPLWRDARADKIEAAEDLAANRAERIRTEAARDSMWLHPAYGGDTTTMPVVTIEPEPDEMKHGEIVAVAVCICAWQNSERVPNEECPLAGHGDPWGGITTAPPTTEQVAERLAEAVFPDRPGCGEPECRGCRRCGWDEPVSSAELVPVTADELGAIGPDRMPRMRWWGWPLMAVLLVVAVLVAVVVIVVELGAVGRERLAERRRRREGARVLAGLLAVAQLEQRPAPGRHRAPAGVAR